MKKIYRIYKDLDETKSSTILGAMQQDVSEEEYNKWKGEKVILNTNIMKKIVYIAHQISGDIEKNLSDLRRIIRKVNLEYSDIAFSAPYYGDIVSLDDNEPLERKRGIDNDTALIMSGMFDELWLTGNEISLGMKEEINLFRSLGKPIINHIGKL